jgi:hypothetical protein
MRRTRDEVWRGRDVAAAEARQGCVNDEFISINLVV